MLVLSYIQLVEDKVIEGMREREREREGGRERQRERNRGRERKERKKKAGEGYMHQGGRWMKKEEKKTGVDSKRSESE